MKIKPFIILIGLLFINLLCFSRDYSVVHIGTKVELKDNYIHCIYKDSDGFIWLGTGTTVERWDGIKSLAYTFPENNLEYAPYLVNTILEREPHDYWIGCKKGLWRLNPVSAKMEQFFPEQINFAVYALAKDLQNKLYIGTENGLYIYTDNKISHIRLISESIPSGNNHVLGVEVIDENYIWLLTPEGLILCEPTSGALKFYPNTMPGCGKLTSISKAGQLFYIGTEKRGILTFDLASNTYLPYWDKIHSPVSALSYENGFLAVATLGQGIQLLSLADHQLVYANSYYANTNRGLISNNFSSILLSDGDIWCGMDYYTGMTKLKKVNTTFSLYSDKGFNSNGVPVRSVFLSGNQLFISNRDGFVCISEDNDEVRYINTKTIGTDKLRSDLIFSFYEYQGALLIGTYAGGVSAMIPETYTFIETPLTEKITKNDIFMFLEDKEGNLWIASSDGLYFYNKDTQIIKEYNTFNCGMPGNMVYGIHIDSSDRFWIATNRGVTLFDRKTEKCSQDVLPDDDCIKGEPVRSIYEGRDGTLFFCILKKTPFALDKDLKSYSYPLTVECYNMIQDQHGVYWLGSPLGIVKMDEGLSYYTLFTAADGLPDAPVSPGAAIVKDNDNRLWIANTKGLVVIDPQMPVSQSPLKITGIFINGESDMEKSLSGKPFTLKKKENNVEFEFVSLGYENPEEMKYEFILEGRDSGWTEQDYKNKVSYYNLPPGEYTFKVRRLLSEDSMTEISFKIGAGFPWLLIIALLVFTCITVLIIRSRKKMISDTVILRENVQSTDSDDHHELDESGSYVKLTDKEAGIIINALKVYMENEKPFLNVDLKQSDVAFALGYSTYVLSAVFTHYLKTGYYDFINMYRIEEFKSRVRVKDYEKYTLFSLAERCGFKSKASFFRVFKKFVGTTPNEYIKQQENSL